MESALAFIQLQFQRYISPSRIEWWAAWQSGHLELCTLQRRADTSDVVNLNNEKRLSQRDAECVSEWLPEH